MKTNKRLCGCKTKNSDKCGNLLHHDYFESNLKIQHTPTPWTPNQFVSDILNGLTTANMTEVELANANVLFSYKTPVAIQIKLTGEVFKTAKFWSRTTSRHISQWVKMYIKPEKVQEKPQEYFDEFSSEVK